MKTVRALYVEVATNLDFDPHTKEYSCCIDHKPSNTSPKEGQLGEAWEKYAEQDDKAHDDPGHEDSLVAHIVQGESVVIHKLRHDVHVVLHC